MTERNEQIGQIFEGDEAILVTRENLSMYLYVGKYALFNHCYISLGQQEAAYIWAHSPRFEQMASIAESYKVSIERDIPEPSENDVNFFVMHSTQDLDNIDELASEWADQQ